MYVKYVVVQIVVFILVGNLETVVMSQDVVTSMVTVKYEKIICRYVSSVVFVTYIWFKIAGFARADACLTENNYYIL